MCGSITAGSSRGIQLMPSGPEAGREDEITALTS